MQRQITTNQFNKRGILSYFLVFFLMFIHIHIHPVHTPFYAGELILSNGAVCGDPKKELCSYHQRASWKRRKDLGEDGGALPSAAALRHEAHRLRLEDRRLAADPDGLHRGAATPEFLLVHRRQLRREDGGEDGGTPEQFTPQPPPSSTAAAVRQSRRHHLRRRCHTSSAAAAVQAASRRPTPPPLPWDPVSPVEELQAAVAFAV
ncbi:PREDICTED: uncharacterized protein LOC109168415 [Ipomoea nil]|uniref:uncharacterized protein LOC109168415 n=1 Tax=Ipomoea nil TaxID=35883 RepID=UPI0009019AA7|nr:PREDICTED: uncharacterized protein LOC109168415 [Ipomoea nil]